LTSGSFAQRAKFVKQCCFQACRRFKIPAGSSQRFESVGQPLLCRQQRRAGGTLPGMLQRGLVECAARSARARHVDNDIAELAAAHHDHLPRDETFPAVPGPRAASLLCSSARERCSLERIVPTAQPVTAAASA
jgi:hypothetical protein